MCKGLLAFHSQNLAFRDLKPANVLIDNDGHGVLMDLGSVSIGRVAIKSRKDALELQELCAATCTAPFRPPELFEPPSITVINETSDIWALACTVYALAYKETPFDGTATAAMSGRVVFQSANDAYGSAFRLFIQDMLVTDHTKRPSASVVLQRAEAMLETLPNGGIMKA